MATHYQSAPQNQVIKGMRRMRYHSPEVSLDDALRSPYVWWWRYLRLSKDYWWVCQKEGKVADKRLRKMYYDFRNVYETTFTDWWRERGFDLFMEQEAFAKVRSLDAMNMTLSRPYSDFLLLEIPVHMTERTIIRQVREHLRQHDERRVERRSSAKRQLAKYVGINQNLIEVARQTWQMHYESRDMYFDQTGKLVKGSKSSYQIGKDLRLVRSCMPQPGDSIEKSRKRVNGMKVAVSRMLKRADNLIANATVGVFPFVKELAEPTARGHINQQKLDDAVAHRVWRPLFDDDDTLIVTYLDVQSRSPASHRLVTGR